MKKKYLFPFEKEKRNIPWAKLLLALTCSYCTFVIIAFAMIKSSREESQNTLDTFYKHSPQLIVVPTGDYGRIRSATQLAKMFNLKKLRLAHVSVFLLAFFVLESGMFVAGKLKGDSN